ncbi:hypothetical protein OB919_13840 [Halobacteria archaeon AArc-curdl1]|uniref:Uncharacterized protein n=1 Tax=Natronosalvus hydrolyticus TaxID=2979988 RepID=A0AAP3E6S8_9EURY|nr:hypothetical protein [Halobacteria archaeon AArc-curdl1]
MSSPGLPAPTLEGTLVALEYPRTDVLECVADEYVRLAETHGARNVLVVKRHPAGLEELERVLASASREAGMVPTPNVEALPEHASKVIEAFDPTIDRLEYEERIELISLVIAGAKRDIPPYLERAREHDSFARDVGQLLLEVTRQRHTQSKLENGDDIHPCLEFLFTMNDRFHAELDARGFIERADVIPRAVESLENNADGVRDRTTAGVDAVLAIQFEEFRELDRRYLAALTNDIELVCVGQRHASVERTRVEPGALETISESLNIRQTSRSEPVGPPHAPIIRWLATGAFADEQEEIRGRAHAYRIRTETAREQTRLVATEIGSLRDRHDWSYDELVVAVPRAERVPWTRRRLREAGIPTATIDTPSLATDPAVAELYAVIRAQQTLEHEAVEIDSETPTDAIDWDDAVIRRLAARVDSFSPELLIECRDHAVHTTLERWIERTDLKGRIADGGSWIDAREQFDSVERILDIARFVERTDLVSPDWDGVQRMVARTIEYDAPHVHTIASSTAEGGVTVCPVDELAYATYNAVFVLDCNDGIYPGSQFLTSLFPTAWLRSMDAFPAVTDPTVTELEDTFRTLTDPETVGDRFETYHVERARRRLALASRAATNRLYLCSYERETDGLRRTHDESRYVRELRASSSITITDVEPTTQDGRVYGPQRTLESVLGEPWGELERVRRRASMGEPVDLAETESHFQEMALLLEDDGLDPTLREAIRTQFEFAAGEVRR